MLMKDKDKRISAIECLNHPWLSNRTYNMPIFDNDLLYNIVNFGKKKK